MKFCSECGASIAASGRPSATPPARYRCSGCGVTHFRNPRIVACCIAEWQGQVLLCRRAIEPSFGLWTLPGGYVEASEPIQQAAAREALEEAMATVDELALFRVYNLPKYNEVITVFRGTLRDGRCAVGEETSEVALFPRRDLPWDTLAFESTRAALHDYATRRWQPVHASPVEDLTWLQPPPVATRRAPPPTRTATGQAAGRGAG
jgi:ADP-ribose pyrophosphatase YjhB (NUDIX family)